MQYSEIKLENGIDDLADLFLDRNNNINNILKMSDEYIVCYEIGYFNF